MEFNREELQQIADTDHVQCGDAAAMARMLLATMQQQPVLSVIFKDGWPEPGSTCLTTATPKLSDGVHEFYAAPPAPVVPDEITFEKIAEITASQGYEYSINECICAASWWNACRSAMLQGKTEHVSNRDELNSPVIPDSWISCSEQIANRCRVS
ncbi:hypothetical protein C7387_4316 [Yokenella regensburgei]|uniref:Eaa protein n=1 Tax=Yokenella regensburgei TaxID=158877 RepID=A0ABX9RT58_9ENTR|nr:hypothetical protein [Yokenella regensburgei]RKR53176.1 hypothetical protein C7387_4316 [Yokenella regensburgei]VFS16139.1 Uncharacterised protein [Yokenella regensburgei]VFS33739.1 Uncharacterised protein [Yokenella regensburgei]